MNFPAYFDCCATTPLEKKVQDTLFNYFANDYGNEGSRTHEFGLRAKQAVQKARDQVAAVVDAKRDEVIFTSGATESNNLALLGLAEIGRKLKKQHIVSTKIEHKAVLEPLELLTQQGFEITWLEVKESGRVNPDSIAEALREDTLLVSVMHANNETGVIQPIPEICEQLSNHDAYFHCDAAQSFGKLIEPLKNDRIDLISISAHKIYGPKGIGALITRRRGFKKCPLTPLFIGGGQERGLRPGTLPVPLIAALGTASELALKDSEKRIQRCLELRSVALEAFAPLEIKISGDTENVLPHVLNFSIGKIDSEALIVSLKELIAISNGSACTSTSYSPSHVLTSMGMSEEEANACVRISWCHLTPDFDWGGVVQRIEKLF